MHVRVKREHQTIFLYTHPSETIATMKENLSEILNVDKSQISLFYEGAECHNQKFVRDFNIENDSVVNMKFSDGL